jgi:hypothetical protein
LASKAADDRTQSEYQRCEEILFATLLFFAVSLRAIGSRLLPRFFIDFSCIRLDQ